MSSDAFKDINEYFNWYKSVYGSEIRFEGEIISPDPKPNYSGAGTPENVLITKRQTSPNGFNEFLVHQDDPSLKAFYQQIKNCEKCALSKTRTHFVFGMGNPKADIMFIGEAPGQDEDLKGFPFVGRAGQLLDKMLYALKLKREEVYIANVLKCRPPNNRDPLPDEVIKCEPYLKKQIEMIGPKVIIALGRISAQVLLKKTDSLSMLRRVDHFYERTPFIVTYHPAALLRNPRWKSNAWDDLVKIKKYMS